MGPVEKSVIVHDGSIKMNGWAYSGGGHWPERVEVSVDGGNVWYETPYEQLSEKYYYAWRTWAIDVPCDAEGWIELVCRCWDVGFPYTLLQRYRFANQTLHPERIKHTAYVHQISLELVLETLSL